MAALIKDRGLVKDRVVSKIRTYGEVVEFLDACPAMEYSEASLKRMAVLDKHFDAITKSIDTVVVGGVNAKSSTMNFATKLFNEEQVKVGLCYSSSFLTYNERLWVNDEQIANKQFTEVLNQVINAVDLEGIVGITVHEIMIMASLLYFKESGVDVALIEVGMGGRLDAANACSPLITAVTRVAHDHNDVLGNDLEGQMKELLGVAKPGAWFISAEQSKIRLAKMKELVEEMGGKWAMPIRKLAALPYIFEQLYGRTVSLAERIVQLYVEDIKGKFSPFLRGNLLATQRGQRGRPTIEAKRRAELNPMKTLKSFWNEQFGLLRGRFELLDREKPTILLDNAHNVDALNNVFLGIRLLHYQRALKGFVLVLGLEKFHDVDELMKAVRYLFKKVNGQIFFVPLSNGKPCHDPVELAKMAHEMGIKTKAFTAFAEAFETAAKAVDERTGLVAITGSPELVSEYWKHKGIKRF